ncbi:MAG TPA: hypothetical protein VEK31_11760 [Xanthobacteraceae bacterium]|nr:hypothetical protein [Xanthobacteraceae bacterium]
MTPRNPQSIFAWPSLISIAVPLQGPNDDDDEDEDEDDDEADEDPAVIREPDEDE